MENYKNTTEKNGFEKFGNVYVLNTTAIFLLEQLKEKEEIVNPSLEEELNIENAIRNSGDSPTAVEDEELIQEVTQAEKDKLENIYKNS